MTIRSRTLIGVAVLLCLVPTWASAEHEVDHRYEVTGFVLDEQEKPLAHTGVGIRLGNDAIGYGRTNAEGYYHVRLHLHDADLGRRLTLKTESGEAIITVTFTPGDNATRRIHYANLIGGKLVEGRFSRMRYALWVYVAPVAVVLLLAGAYVLEQRRRRARRRALAKAQGPKKRRR